MGRFSETIFGKSTLPEKCIIYAGAYIPSRKEAVRSLFDGWTTLKGNWLKYTITRHTGNEFLVVFGVYGAAMALETLHVLKDGRTKQIFFIGSMYAKALEIGTLVAPTQTVDRAGLVLLDDSKSETARPTTTSFKQLAQTLHSMDLPYVRAKIASVPCVLHDIAKIKSLVATDPTIAGIEMETSTLYHFSKKLGLKSFALLYVSDNQKHDIIDQNPDVKNAQKNALRNITKVAIRTLTTSPTRV